MSRSEASPRRPAVLVVGTEVPDGAALVRALHRLGRVVVAGSADQAVLQELEGDCALALTVGLSDPRSLPLSIETAQARVGPITGVVFLVAEDSAQPGAAMGHAVDALAALGALLPGCTAVVVGTGPVGAGVAAWARLEGHIGGMQLRGLSLRAGTLGQDDVAQGVVAGVVAAGAAPRFRAWWRRWS